MASYNKILKKRGVGKVMKEGVEYMLSVATETSDWTLPESIAEMIAKRAGPIIENSKTPVPAGAVEI